MNNEKEIRPKGIGYEYIQEYVNEFSCQNGMTNIVSNNEPELNVKDYISITKDVILQFFKNIPNPKELFQEQADITRMLKRIRWYHMYVEIKQKSTNCPTLCRVFMIQR